MDYQWLHNTIEGRTTYLHAQRRIE